MKFIMISDVRVQQIQASLEKHGEEELAAFLENALQPSNQAPLHVALPQAGPREVEPGVTFEVPPRRRPSHGRFIAVKE